MTEAPPPLPRGALMVDLYGPSLRWLLSTPAQTRAEADEHLRRVKARVQLPGAVALVQQGAHVIHCERRGPDAWQVVEAPSP